MHLGPVIHISTQHPSHFINLSMFDYHLCHCLYSIFMHLFGFSKYCLVSAAEYQFSLSLGQKPKKTVFIREKGQDRKV